MAVPSLTILVPTNDRPDVLARVWPTWLEQEGLAQIVVVNDGSARDYSEVFKDLTTACRARGVELRIVTLAQRVGAPGARNAGVAVCVGDEIFTVDDDIVLTKNVVERCRAARGDATKPTIVGPRVVYMRDGESEVDAEVRSTRDVRAYCDVSTVTVVPWVKPPAAVNVPFVTAVALWPRAVFDNGVRYFEGYSGNGYREETDPQLQAQELCGADVLFAPSATVYHLAPRVAYANASGQRRGWLFWYEWHVAKNNAVFMKRHGRLLSSRFGVRPRLAWVRLFASRISLRRVGALMAHIKRARLVGR